MSDVDRIIDRICGEVLARGRARILRNTKAELEAMSKKHVRSLADDLQKLGIPQDRIAYELSAFRQRIEAETTECLDELRRDFLKVV
jgi:hypothetical protein